MNGECSWRSARPRSRAKWTAGAGPSERWLPTARSVIPSTLTSPLRRTSKAVTETMLGSDATLLGGEGSAKLWLGLRRQGSLAGHLTVHQLQEAVALEGLLSSEGLVAHHAEAIDVGSLVHRFAQTLLGRHVVGRADGRAGAGAVARDGLGLTQQLGDAEIEQPSRWAVTPISPLRGDSTPGDWASPNRA